MTTLEIALRDFALLKLNRDRAALESKGQPSTPPGLPGSSPDRKYLTTGDCIEPLAPKGAL